MNIWYLCFRQGFPGISNLIRANPNGPHPVDPEGSHPVETEGPHPFESRKDPVKRTRRTVSGRNSSGSWSHQGSRPRAALIRSTPTGSHPVEAGRTRTDRIRPSSGRPRPTRIRINRPGRIRGNSSKLRHIQVNSGQTQANPADKGKHKQLQHIHANKGKNRQTKANTGKQKQTPAYSRKQRQNSSIFKHEKGKETFEVHIRLSAGGASGAQPYVGAALQGCAGEVDSAHAQAQHRICR